MLSGIFRFMASWKGLALGLALLLLFNVGNSRNAVANAFTGFGDFMRPGTMQAGGGGEAVGPVDATDNVTDTAQAANGDFVTREEYEKDQKEVNRRLTANEKAIKAVKTELQKALAQSNARIKVLEDETLPPRVAALEEQLKNAVTQDQLSSLAKAIENFDRLVEARLAECGCGNAVPKPIERVTNFCPTCQQVQLQPVVGVHPNPQLVVVQPQPQQPQAPIVINPQPVVVQPQPQAPIVINNPPPNITIDLGGYQIDITNEDQLYWYLNIWNMQKRYDTESSALFCELCLMPEVWPFCRAKFPNEAEACRTLATAFPGNTATPPGGGIQPLPTPWPTQQPWHTPQPTGVPPTAPPVPTPTPTQVATNQPPPPQNCVNGYPLAGQVSEAYDTSGSRYPTQDLIWTCDGRLWAFRQPVNTKPFNVSFNIKPGYAYTLSTNMCRVCIDENRNGQGCGNPSQRPENGDRFTITTSDGGDAWGVMECEGHRDAGAEIKVTSDTAPPSRPTPGTQICTGGVRPTQYWARMENGSAPPPLYYAQWDCAGNRLWMPAWDDGVPKPERLCFSIGGMPLPPGIWKWEGTEMDLYVNGEWKTGANNSHIFSTTSDSTVEVRWHWCEPDGTNESLGFSITRIIP